MMEKFNSELTSRNNQGFSRYPICIVEVGGEQFKIIVTTFEVGGEKNLSRLCRDVRSV